MSQPRLDQLLAGYADGDAISRQAVILRDVFRRWGFASDIFADTAHVSPTLRADCRPLKDYTGGASDIVLHHYGLASLAAEHFAATAAQKILINHNITPSEYFRGFDDAVVQQLEKARRHVAELARQCQAVWAVSQYDASDLTALGVGCRFLILNRMPFRMTGHRQPPELKQIPL